LILVKRLLLSAVVIFACPVELAIKVCPVSDVKSTVVSDVFVTPETVVPVPPLSKTFSSSGCGLLPPMKRTDAEAGGLPAIAKIERVAANVKGAFGMASPN
jgi:hypothetical protein